MNVLKLYLLMLVVSGCGDNISKEVYQKDMKLALAERDKCKKEKALLHRENMKLKGCTSHWWGWNCPAPEAEILPVEE